MRKLLDSKVAKIAIIIFIVLFVLAGVATGVVLGTGITKKLLAPVAVLEEIPADNGNLTVTLKWNAINRAIGYNVQYKYEILGDTITEIDVKSSKISIPRVKGKLEFRIKTYSKNEKLDSDYSEWSIFNIPAIKLHSPKSKNVLIGVKFDGALKYYGIYGEIWENVTYYYGGKASEIIFYEVCVVRPGRTLEYELLQSDVNDRIMPVNTLLGFKFNFGPGEWKVYIRAVNNRGEFGEYNEDPAEQSELYYLFGSSDWTCVEISVP
ncbi:MAG: hypothetical protein LBU04_02010 [Christensenellaceae bacterium]|jgi:hypothetical protein|nr:hypothetical protein [Christensenellaceae bacterium]